MRCARADRQSASGPGDTWAPPDEVPSFICCSRCETVRVSCFWRRRLRRRLARECTGLLFFCCVTLLIPWQKRIFLLAVGTRCNRAVTEALGEGKGVRRDLALGGLFLFVRLFPPSSTPTGTQKLDTERGKKKRDGEGAAAPPLPFLHLALAAHLARARATMLPSKARDTTTGDTQKVEFLKQDYEKEAEALGLEVKANGLTAKQKGLLDRIKMIDAPVPDRGPGDDTHRSAGCRIRPDPQACQPRVRRDALQESSNHLQFKYYPPDFSRAFLKKKSDCDFQGFGHIAKLLHVDLNKTSH